MGLCLSSKGKQRPTIPVPSPWSDLPPELAGLVVSLLPSHLDRLSFRAVCRRWRLAAQNQQQPSPPPALPWLRLNGLVFQSLPGGELVRFTDADLHASAACVGCVDGWQLCDRYNSNNTRTRFLANPFSGATIEMPTSRFQGCVGSSVELGMRKVIVCSPGLVAASLFGGGAVGFYRPGDPSWSVCPSVPCRVLYVDIAFHHGRLYALSTKEELFVYETGGGAKADSRALKPAFLVEHVIKRQAALETHQEEEEEEEELFTRLRRYLVASSSKLLMVTVELRASLPDIRNSTEGRSIKASEKVQVKVYEADLISGRWLQVKNLDDGQALFVGGSYSKSHLLSGHDQKFKGNRVYFTGIDFAACCQDLKADSRDIPSYGFYDTSSGTVGKIFLNGTKGVHRPEWFFPSL